MKSNMLFLVLFLLSISCQLEPSQPTTEEAKTDQAQFSLALTQAALGPLAEDSNSLSLDIYNVNNNKKGDLEKNYSFTISEEGIYRIVDLKIGPKIFHLDLLDFDKNILASAEFSYLVKPGSQQMNEIFLIPIQNTIVPLSLSVGIELQNFPPDLNPVSLPDNVESILNKYSCLGCHGPGNSGLGGLDLVSFPFQSKIRKSLPEIVTEINKRVINASRPMPPNGDLLDQDEVTILKNWEKVVQTPILLKVFFVDEKGVESQLVNKDNSYIWDENEFHEGMVGEFYKGIVKVVLLDEIILLEEAVQWTIDLKGAMRYSKTISYEQPEVSIPVVIK